MKRSISTPEFGGRSKAAEVEEENGKVEAVALTVWKKSLVLNCNGFTVFDGRGNLVFRVDNYVAANKAGEIVLMDAIGKCLLTIRRKVCVILTLLDRFKKGMMEGNKDDTFFSLLFI